MRSAVEREFIITGEALSRIGALEEWLVRAIPHSGAIVDFRNMLAHDYGAGDDGAVFGLFYSGLIVLKTEAGEPLRGPPSRKPAMPFINAASKRFLVSA